MSRPLNFLQVTTFYPPYSFGGDAGYVYRLAGALADAGHCVDVLHFGVAGMGDVVGVDRVTEIVRDSGGGVLFKTDRDLAEALQTLSRDPSLRRELGERGYCMVKERWSKAAHLPAYLSLLDLARKNRDTRGV